MADTGGVLKVCLNGARTPAEHPGLPLTPARLAGSARDAVRAGADAIHLHPRGADGSESLLAVDVAGAVAAVRAACPGVPVGVSTGLWITARDPRARLELVGGWVVLRDAERPDFASVNLSEPGTAELAGLLHDLGIGVEAGVWTAHDARALAPSSTRPASIRTVLPGLVRVLVEIIGVPPEQAVAEADAVLAALGDPGVPVLLHGEREACWPVLRHAAGLGLPTRIGLEDVLTGPDGEPVAGNADLVRHAREIIG
ncbi:3-keto-5-aminohexanoate cleavage protein [Kineosporia sp. J2-2]|uniref:3-keto-5-aminohexanoate cleavage protein n=1 Tax=Kineosporia corallincola TaxID=2835133 RepID=A0ABS5TQK0_9ACTN|nr:3-keto-5-aminohexanoate cleavage protein [Kineosporia corallincola]MBT0772348.1 3-keto-5-aminohexanoate cleavage protein [Kineosporia corallincola]